MIADSATNLAVRLTHLAGCVDTGRTTAELMRLNCEAIEFHMDAIEEEIFEALIALRRRGADDSSVLIEEPRSGKFVQFGRGRKIVMDVPCVGLSSHEADRASAFFRELGEDYPLEYHAPDPANGKTHHGATFNHDFGDNAREAAKAATLFFEKVYRFSPAVELSIEEL